MVFPAARREAEAKEKGTRRRAKTPVPKRSKSTRSLEEAPGFDVRIYNTGQTHLDRVPLRKVGSGALKVPLHGTENPEERYVVIYAADGEYGPQEFPRERFIQVEDEATRSSQNNGGAQARLQTSKLF